MKGLILLFTFLVSISASASLVNFSCEYANFEKESFTVDFNSELEEIEVRGHTLYFPTSGLKNDSALTFKTGNRDDDSSISLEVEGKKVLLDNIRIYEVRLAGAYGTTYTFSANYENNDSSDDLQCKMFYWSL
jgi:hypothetical protein